MYWRTTGNNLPIFVIPTNEKKDFNANKQLASRGIYPDIPQTYRKHELDVYPEDTISFINKQVKGRRIMKYLKQRAENYNQ